MGIHSISTAAQRAAASRSQTVTGLVSAAAIAAGWITVLGYGLFAVDLATASPLLVVGLAALACWLFVGLFIVAHDAMHGSLAPGNPKLNAWIGGAIMLAYAGFSFKAMRSAHFEHHRHAGTAADPDFAAAHPSNPVRWYLAFLKRYFGWRSVVFVGAAVAALHFLAGVSVANIVVFYGLPAIASSVQLFYFGTFRPHRHAERDFADRHRARSDNFGTLASLASCYHFGYHLEHHRRPDIPWWGLPRARREGVGS